MHPKQSYSLPCMPLLPVVPKNTKSKGESRDSASINKSNAKFTVIASIYQNKHYTKHNSHAYVMRPCNASFNLYLFSYFTGNAGYTTVDVYPCLRPLAQGSRAYTSRSIGNIAHHLHDEDLCTMPTFHECGGSQARHLHDGDLNCIYLVTT